MVSAVMRVQHGKGVTFTQLYELIVGNPVHQSTLLFDLHGKRYIYTARKLAARKMITHSFLAQYVALNTGPEIAIHPCSAVPC